MTLADIFKRHSCDKYTHCYHKFYETLPPPARLLEVGVWKGASLRAWREWWPKADILGADTFERGPAPTDFPPFSNPSVVQVDSRTYDFTRFYEDGERPDLVIDDGSHKPRDQAATFRNLWSLVAPGGTYVVEDVVLHDRPLSPWFESRAVDFHQAALEELIQAITDAGVEYVCHDYRAKSGKPDSVLVVVRKPNTIVREPRDKETNV